EADRSGRRGGITIQQYVAKDPSVGELGRGSHGHQGQDTQQASAEDTILVHLSFLLSTNSTDCKGSRLSMCGLPFRAPRMAYLLWVSRAPWNLLTRDRP